MMTRVSAATTRLACTATRLSKQGLPGTARGVPRSTRHVSSGTPSGDLGRARPHVEVKPAGAADQSTHGSGRFWTDTRQAVAVGAWLATIGLGGLGGLGYQQYRLMKENAEREARERDVVRAVLSGSAREEEPAPLVTDNAEREARAQDVVRAVLSGSAREEELHLSRAIDEQLRGLVFKRSRAIYVVVGPRGAGKSQAIHAAVHGQSGAIVVNMVGSDTLEEKIAEHLRRHGASKATSDDVQAALQQVITAKRAEPGVPEDWVPTLVVEVDPQFPISKVDALMNAAKALGPDGHLCVPLVIFSDMRAAHAFDGMGGRVRHIAVRDLTMEEVEQLAEVVRSAETLHASMATPEQRREFVRMCGSRVGLLVPALAEGRDVVTTTIQAWASDAVQLWHCKYVPEERAAVRALLRALARKYQQAKADAEASGSVLRVDEVAITEYEAGMSPHRLGRIMSQLGKAHAVQAYNDRFVFISPVAAEEVLKLVHVEQEQERLELERKEVPRQWY